jgi:hypothetical protein
MCAADIRSSLPDDAKRFESIDAEVKDILREVRHPV